VLELANRDAITRHMGQVGTLRCDLEIRTSRNARSILQHEYLDIACTRDPAQILGGDAARPFD
jgi:hypothetical protein